MKGNMFRRLFNSVIEVSSPSTESVLYPHPFTKSETSHLGWITNYAPCFPVKSNNIKILTEPDQFYDTIISKCKSATKRITLVSLYLGNGNLEKKIVDTLMNNENFKNKQLTINVLIDFMRGSRLQNNSRKMLQPLLNQNDENCRVSLYHTPELRGLAKKLTPNRWNELLGLQHMKLYIFDDTLIISGANLSNDYFTNRQDRYFMIKDKQLSDFYCGLVRKVQNFSLQMDKKDNIKVSNNWKCSPYEGEKNEFIKNAGDSVEQYLLDVRDEKNIHKQDGFDTWIFPLVQMGQLGIEQDAQVTDRILAEAPRGGKLNIASGYFNFTSQYMDTIIHDSQAQCNILMAHPKANGFLGAKGAAGGIPSAYTLIAKKFKKQFENCGQENRIELFEYLRIGWTYHAKGLWYYAPKNEYPCMTLIGSPNFGERSVKKDLESQLAIITENKDLQKKLHEECSRLYQLGLPADTEREVPKWVHVMVYLFRSYF